MMDALEFFKARKRMCKATKCASCKLGHMQGGCCIAPEIEKIDACEEAIAIVEQWAAEHPVKTRQSVFLKMFPHVMLDDKGQFGFCPKMLDTAYHPVGGCCLDVDICQRCMDNFWGQEVEE